MIPCPSGLGMLGIFSRLTTGTNKLGREFGGGVSERPCGREEAKVPVLALTRGCCPCPAARAGAGLAHGHLGASPAAPWLHWGSRRLPAAR